MLSHLHCPKTWPSNNRWHGAPALDTGSFVLITPCSTGLKAEPCKSSAWLMKPLSNFGMLQCMCSCISLQTFSACRSKRVKFGANRRMLHQSLMRLSPTIMKGCKRFLLVLFLRRRRKAIAIISVTRRSSRLFDRRMQISMYSIQFGSETDKIDQGKCAYTGVTSAAASYARLSVHICKKRFRPRCFARNASRYDWDREVSSPAKV